MFKTVIRVLVVFLMLTDLGYSQSNIKITSEKTNFEDYTSYPEMMDFLKEVKSNSSIMKLGSFGTSIEGREQPYALFSKPSISQPWEALVSGKPIVAIAANVHGNERTLRESNMMLIRELATDGSEMNKLLDYIVVIMVPSINVDGFKVGDGATRGNSQGVDMNRDYIKLEQAALTNYVQNIANTWHPHMLIDAHNGGAWPYHITYLATSNASADQRLTKLADESIFPYLNKKVKQGGYEAFYYSNGNEKQWNGGGSDPRIGRNYLGFTNSVGILFESPGYLMDTAENKKKGTIAGLIAYKSILQWAANNPKTLMSTVARARNESIVMGDNAKGDIAVQMKYESDGKVNYTINSAKRGEERVAKKVTGDIMKKPVATKFRKRPWAYILPPKAKKAAKMLGRHGITIELLQEEMEIAVEAYELVDIKRNHVYDHVAAAQVVTLAEKTVKTTVKFPKGSFVIKTGQTMGRVIAHMLEPETNDNVITWNTMDAILPTPTEGMSARQKSFWERNGSPAPLVPIYKLMKRKALPIKIMK